MERFITFDAGKWHVVEAADHADAAGNHGCSYRVLSSHATEQEAEAALAAS